MRPVVEGLPPGVIVLQTGELSRYTSAMQALFALNTPKNTVTSWFRGVLIVDGLNKGLQAMIDNPKMEWAWIMGDDHTMDPNILLRQIVLDVDACIPVCLHRVPPFNTSIMRYGNIETGEGAKPVRLDELPTNGLYQLPRNKLCGDAGLLVRRRVIERMKPPYYDTRRSGSLSSDDQAFCRRLHDVGAQVFVVCDIVLGHIMPFTIEPRVSDKGRWQILLWAGDQPVVALAPESWEGEGA